MLTRLCYLDGFLLSLLELGLASFYYSGIAHLRRSSLLVLNNRAGSDLGHTSGRAFCIRAFNIDGVFETDALADGFFLVRVQVSQFWQQVLDSIVLYLVNLV